MNEVLHHLNERRAAGGSLPIDFFVAERPGENRGMIPVAPDHAGELAQRLGVRSEPAVFIQHQHSQLVARVEQFRGRLIVRRAIAGRTHLLQSFDAVILEAVRQRRTHASVVLVVGHALNENVLSIQE